MNNLWLALNLPICPYRPRNTPGADFGINTPASARATSGERLSWTVDWDRGLALQIARPRLFLQDQPANPIGSDLLHSCIFDGGLQLYIKHFEDTASTIERGVVVFITLVA